MDKKTSLNQDELVDIYVNAWNTLNADILEPILDENFRYGSMWVLQDLVGKNAYMEYIRGKFNTIRRTGSIVKARRGTSPQTGLARVELIQDNHRTAKIDVETSYGLMSSAYIHDL